MKKDIATLYHYAKKLCIIWQYIHSKTAANHHDYHNYSLNITWSFLTLFPPCDPFKIAALNGHDLLVKVLVERGADPNMKTEFGTSAKEMAVSFDRRVRQNVLLHLIHIHKLMVPFDWSICHFLVTIDWSTTSSSKNVLLPMWYFLLFPYIIILRSKFIPLHALFP